MKAVIILAAALASSAVMANEIVIRDAWIREAPPVASVQAGYFTACNNGQADVTLTAVESDAFGRIEMHETIETESTSRMERLDGVSIEAGECIEFTRGGKHLMLFDATARLADGDSASLTLVFDAQRIRIDVPVLRGDGPGNDSDDHAHHQGH